MAIDYQNDVSFIDPIEGSDIGAPELQSKEEQTAQENQVVIDTMLAANGVSDTSNIKFGTVDGKIVSRDWNDLNLNEKLRIAGSANNADPNIDLTDQEIHLLNTIRANKLTPNEFVGRIYNEGAQENATEKPYDVDSMTDEELFLLDTLAKFGDEYVSDDELERMLSNAKNDPQLFEKTMSNMRSEYKRKEDEQLYNQQQERIEKAQQEANEFEEMVLDSIGSFSSVAGKRIDLTKDEMEDLASFILDKDLNGNSEFGRMMNNPKTFTELAFWARNGRKVMNEISDQLRKEYRRGVEDGRRSTPRVAINRGKAGYGTPNKIGTNKIAQYGANAMLQDVW